MANNLLWAKEGESILAEPTVLSRMCLFVSEYEKTTGPEPQRIHWKIQASDTVRSGYSSPKHVLMIEIQKAEPLLTHLLCKMKRLSYDLFMGMYGC